VKRSRKTDTAKRKRPLGLYRGQFWIAPDFDAPLDPNIFEGEGLEPDGSGTPDKEKLPEEAERGKNE
jgi:hypothetical protein